MRFENHQSFSGRPAVVLSFGRSEEHTSELQSQSNLVCRLLLEKKTEERAHPTRGRAHRDRHLDPPQPEPRLGARALAPDTPHLCADVAPPHVNSCSAALPETMQ